mmetsp:Transcript_2256/g.2552  ORF Transcript_2256/g.2552 Transcript_2256/m.2552 type:complete len:210 (+) Transcript_2256:100-729(+)
MIGSVKHGSVIVRRIINNVNLQQHQLPFGRSTVFRGLSYNTSSIDYFKIMGIEQTFGISIDTLKTEYKKLMNKHHPDRHTLKPLSEQETAAEEASLVTRGYEVLKDDYERALHLLELSGVPMEDNVSGDIVGQEVLMNVMELREEVDDAKSDDKLKHLLDMNKERIRETCDNLGLAFEKGDLKNAKRFTAMLQYWNRIEEMIIEKISSP